MILTVFLAVAAALGLFAGVTAVGVALIERAHPPAGRFVEVSGQRLHLVEMGIGADIPDRPAVVLIHGASGNLEDMRLALGNRLSGRYRVVLIDRPGHGWSERGSGGEQASPAHQAALIHAALAKLGIARAVIVAHSWAGSLATAYALNYPDGVTGMVLLAPATHSWSTGIAWYYNLLTTPVVGPLFAYTLGLPLGAAVIGPGVTAVFSPQPAPPDYIRDTALMLGLRPAELLANAEDVAGLNAFVAAQSPRYPEIAAPTIIFAGSDDTTVSPRIHAQALAAALPHARLVMLPHVGHLPQYAMPEAVVAAIDEVAKNATPVN
jgi:pimeloyl-ACP methyl ester carboxylesterase